jgi:DNA-binding MarR family transcriptional regulator
VSTASSTLRLVTELLKTLPELGRALHSKPDSAATRAACEGLPEHVLEKLRAGQPPTPAQVQLAVELAIDGPATVSELVHRLGVSAPAVSLLVDRMTEHGMVERTRDTADRRMVWVRLTPTAQAIADALLGVWRAQLTRFMELVPEAEREAFVRNVALFARVLGPAHEPAHSTATSTEPTHREAHERGHPAAHEAGHETPAAPTV